MVVVVLILCICCICSICIALLTGLLITYRKRQIDQLIHTQQCLGITVRGNSTEMKELIDAQSDIANFMRKDLCKTHVPVLINSVQTSLLKFDDKNVRKQYDVNDCDGILSKVRTSFERHLHENKLNYRDIENARVLSELIIKLIEIKLKLSCDNGKISMHGLSKTIINYLESICYDVDDTSSPQNSVLRQWFKLFKASRKVDDIAVERPSDERKTLQKEVVFVQRERDTKTLPDERPISKQMENKRPSGSSYCTHGPDYDCYIQGWPSCCQMAKDQGGCPSTKPPCERLRPRQMSDSQSHETASIDTKRLPDGRPIIKPEPPSRF